MLGRYYVGSTENIERRLFEHNTGQSRYTSRGKPWELVYTIGHQSRSAALKLETKIKKRGASRYLADNGIF
jgi:putative endonuclease